MLRIDELTMEYAKQFGEGFPSFQVLQTVSEQEGERIVEECLQKNKTAYELGYATLEDDIEY